MKIPTPNNSNKKSVASNQLQESSDFNEIRSGKITPTVLSIPKLLKLNLLEEENVEDLHFSFVALNSYKMRML